MVMTSLKSYTSNKVTDDFNLAIELMNQTCVVNFVLFGMAFNWVCLGNHHSACDNGLSVF